MNEPESAPRDDASSPDTGDNPSSACSRSATRRGCTRARPRNSRRLVDQFDAVVKVTRGTETVGGNSIMGLMMLAAGHGTSITVEATGPQAAEVIEALAKLVSGRFTEDE